MLWLRAGRVGVVSKVRLGEVEENARGGRTKEGFPLALMRKASARLTGFGLAEVKAKMTRREDRVMKIISSWVLRETLMLLIIVRFQSASSTTATDRRRPCYIPFMSQGEERLDQLTKSLITKPRLCDILGIEPSLLSAKTDQVRSGDTRSRT